MPGWIDMHVHQEKYCGDGFTQNDADIAFNSIGLPMVHLWPASPLCAILVLGINVSLRNTINKVNVGPRLTAEKALASTGGHATQQMAIARLNGIKGQKVLLIA
jgi:hypothetical protein